MTTPPDSEAALERIDGPQLFFLSLACRRTASVIIPAPRPSTVFFLPLMPTFARASAANKSHRLLFAYRVFFSYRVSTTQRLRPVSRLQASFKCGLRTGSA